MASIYRHKRNATAGVIPPAGNLFVGELAINTADGKVFTKKDNGTVVEIGGGSSSSSVDLFDTKREMHYLKNANATTYTAVGMIAPTSKTAGALASQDGFAVGEQPWMNHPTTAVANNSSGIISANFSQFSSYWNPEMVFNLKTDLTTTAGTRIWVGFTSADLSAIATPTNQHVAAFRYDTSLGATQFSTVTCNSNAGGATVITSLGPLVNANTIFRLKIALTETDCKFYINDILVSTHTTRLPLPTTGLGYCATTTTLTAAIRNLRHGRLSFRHN